MSFLKSLWVSPADYASAAEASARLTIDRLTLLEPKIAERFNGRYERAGLITGYALGNAMNNLQAVKSRAKVDEHAIANELSHQFLLAKLGIEAWRKLVEASPCFRVARTAGDFDANVVRANPHVDPTLLSRSLIKIIEKFESNADTHEVRNHLGQGNLSSDVLKLAIAHYRAT